ncbi:MAG: Uma2 family endonuclease [Spirochaetes bacterium]|nr:Uma2 family endonuclease [Spirochaetota bacterium]
MALRQAAYFSEQQYLDYESQAATKNEYWFGEVLAMTGVRLRHNIVTSNVITALSVKLREAAKECIVLGSDMKLRAEHGSIYFYPDVMVRCGKQKNDMNAVFIENPNLVIEVFSTTTRDFDRTAKLLAYQKIPSVDEILLIEPTAVKVEYFFRTQTAFFDRLEFNILDDELFLQRLGVALPLTEIYRGIAIL